VSLTERDGARSSQVLRPHVRVLVVGAGFAGLAMAVRMKQAGIDDFVVLERGDDVGGTWRDNTYPGAACDVPSHLYSFSFAPNPRWSRAFSPQWEILNYLRDVARRYGIVPHLRLRTGATALRWDDDGRCWVVDVETPGGDAGNGHTSDTAGTDAAGTDTGASSRGYTADVVVGAMGALSEPALPDIPGIETFAGTLFHSAAWDHGHDLTGERVAVIGTGASAIQFVPEIQPSVGHLDVYQRTPPWIVPRRDRALRPLERRLFRVVPALQQAVRASIYWVRELLAFGFTHPGRMQAIQRVAAAHLAHQVPDPELRRKLTPSYTIGCKRILISNDWYPALQQANVDLVTDGIVEVRPHSIVTADGTERPADTIISATGFHVTDFPAGRRIHGPGGATLSDVWQERGSMEAYLGTTVAGFPNLFLLVGPNTGLGHTSMVFMIESQVAYVVDALAHMDSTAAATLAVRPEAQTAYNERLQRRLARTVWNRGGCRSWYLDANGRNTSLWPGSTWTFRRRTRRFDPWAYVTDTAPAPTGTSRAAPPRTADDPAPARQP
jgi:cation diffusion facilitator CzcD-associated flavoprotein CzcO